MEVFNLDIIPGKSVPVIHASQFDAGREFKANLFEGPTVYTLSGAETLSVIVRKPDGNMVTAAVTNTSDSYITFKTTEQMTACDGANLCELRIENGADVIGSINFIMEVEKSPDTGITSASEIHNLAAQVDAFTAIAVANQYDSANVIFDNTPTPGHGNGYAVTSEGVATALGTKADTSSLATVATAGTLSSLNDTNITTPSNGQTLSYNGSKWVNKSVETTISVARGSTLPNTFPLPNVSRRGNVCVVNFAIQIPAGTYSNTTTLWELSPKPIANTRCMLAFSANPNNFTNLNLLTDGTVKFNGSQTVASDSWLIGQAVYLTDG